MVNAQLDLLLENDIIEPATGPTTWVSPMVVVPKQNGTVRIRMNITAVNKAVKPYTAMGLNRRDFRKMNKSKVVIIIVRQTESP